MLVRKSMLPRVHFNPSTCMSSAWTPRRPLRCTRHERHEVRGGSRLRCVELRTMSRRRGHRGGGGASRTTTSIGSGTTHWTLRLQVTRDAPRCKGHARSSQAWMWGTRKGTPSAPVVSGRGLVLCTRTRSPWGEHLYVPVNSGNYERRSTATQKHVHAIAGHHFSTNEGYSRAAVRVQAELLSLLLEWAL